MIDNLERRGREILAEAGVAVGGDSPWDIRVNDPKFYATGLAGGSLGLGEAYVERWWDSEALDQTMERLARARLCAGARKAARRWFPGFRRSRPGGGWCGATAGLERRHGIGADFYRALLDETTQGFSCGYWRKANSLDQAQANKLDLVCRKIGLRPGFRVLEIGAGCGGFAAHAARHHGVSVHAIVASPAQLELARERCDGLDVELVLGEEAGVSGLGTFDRAVCLGGGQNFAPADLPRFVREVHGALGDDGLFLLETIGVKHSGAGADPWFAKHVTGVADVTLPSVAELGRAIEGLFVAEDWHNFGADYDPTLGAWSARLEAARDKELAGCDERLFRTWRFLLQGGQGAFRARAFDLWQVVLAKKPVDGGWRLVR